MHRRCQCMLNVKVQVAEPVHGCLYIANNIPESLNPRTRTPKKHASPRTASLSLSDFVMEWSV